MAQGGVPANDRKRGADFRRLALEYGIKFWETASETEKKELFFRLAPNLIPRLNEHTGAGGEPLTIIFDPSFCASPSETKNNSTEQGTV